MTYRDPQPASGARSRVAPLLLALAAAALLSAPTVFAQTGAPPQSVTASLPGLETVDLAVMEPVDEARYLREDAERAAQGIAGPYRFAAPLAVSMTLDNAGTWHEIEGGRVWRLQVVSTGARTLNFGFSRFHLPEGATLHFLPAGGTGWTGPFIGADATPDGEFWSPVIEGDAVVIELFVPRNVAEEPELLLVQVAHDYRGFGQLRERLDKSGWCNNDVVCPEWDPWDDQINSEGVYTLNGSWTCSGQMINSNVPGTPLPYFLTADHCGISSGNAGTMRVYWNFQSPVCGQHGGGSLAQNQLGATFKADWSTSDFCLVQLNADPDEDWNVYYTGWNAEESHAPANCHAIHHPGTDEKSISYNGDPITVTSYLGTTVPGNGSHWRVDDWEDGTTEGGSSGSGIWDPDHRLVGQLHGGYASCSSITSDWYGRLSRSWTGGGANNNRLSNWLDPNGTGSRVLDGRYRNDPGSVEPPVVAAHGQIGVAPNPARGPFRVSFHLPGPAHVGAELFDAAGRLAGAVAPRFHAGGAGLLTVGAEAGSRLGPGIYFVRLTADGAPAGSRKLIVVE